MKQWVVRGEIPDDVSAELAGLPEITKKLLFYRNIKTRKEAEEFLSPQYGSDEHNPLKIFNMDKAVERILKAVRDNERVVVFGDYDADGICASVVFHDFFKKIGFENFHVHIPDRYLDGYGLSAIAIEEFAKQKAKLIITLDCGITNFKETEKANSLGIDVIIIDHHLPPENLPPACAVVDLKQKDETYPFNSLAGAGIAFKTVCAIIKTGRFKIVSGWEKWLLDVVAIATVADMVPIVKENRTLVHYGLKVLKKTQRPGLLSFYKRCSLSPSYITEDDLSFTIAPRLNVAGRMDHATVSFNLLITQSRQEADWIGGRLEELSAERRRVVDDIMRKIEAEFGSGEPEVVATGDESWSPGVLGLTANRVMEKYNCPVFLWGKGGGNIKGSCRSNGAVHLVDFMNELPKDLFLDIGGHAMSAGFTVELSKAENLKKEIIGLYEKYPKKEIDDVINIDKEIKIDEVDWTLFSVIESLQPFGAENPKPVFAFHGVGIFRVKKFGNGGVHLQIDFKRTDGTVISAIGFFMAQEKDFDLKAGDKIDLAATLEKNCYRGKEELRLRIIDIYPVKYPVK